MTVLDAYGNSISTKNPDAQSHYDLGVQIFLGAGYGAVQAFAAAVAADPDFALGHAGLARALMMEARMPEAKDAIVRAQGLVIFSSDRERSHVAAFVFLLNGNPQGARATIKSHVRDYPRDAMAAQLCTNVFGLIGFSGEVGREAELLAFTEMLLPHYQDDWWTMSMHALSLCETGQVGASNSLMERSLAINPRNANGAHFRARTIRSRRDSRRTPLPK